jgi:hypothetical protein
VPPRACDSGFWGPRTCASDPRLDPLAQALDQYVEKLDRYAPNESPDHEAGENRRADSAAAAGASACRDHEPQDAEDEREGVIRAGRVASLSPFRCGCRLTIEVVGCPPPRR